MIKVKQFEFNLFGVNTYVLWDADTLQAAVVDPGMSDPDECRTLSDFIELQRLQVVMLVNTHLHIDHTLGNDYVKERYDVGLTAHPADAPLGAGRAEQARMFRLAGAPLTPVTIDVPVKQGDKLYLGQSSLEVLEVPGHSPGSIALYSEADGFVITGDALFRGSIGRTDLPGGDHATLVGAITSRLLSLPGTTMVYPGHGPVTTIATEARSNPYL